MASINYAFKEISCKIVFYGPGLCGKTTNLQAIHTSVPQKFRGDLVSLATEQDRTLFFDFLPLDLGEVRGFKTKFQLYTVPGQVYYNATRRLVLRGVDGIVFVADSAREAMENNRESLANLRENLESYDLNLDQMPWVIQFNKRDLPTAVPREEMEAILNPDHVPSIEAVAPKGIGVKETLKSVATLVLRRLSEMTETAVVGASTLERKAAEQQVVRAQKVSLAAGPTEVAAAAASATASPAAAAKPVPPVAAAGETQRPGRPAAQTGPTVAPVRARVELPDLHVLQSCDMRWGGLRIGAAVVEVSRRATPDRKIHYFLNCQTTCLGLFRNAWNCTLEWGAEETKTVDSQPVSFYVLKATSSARKREPDIHVWVKNAFDKACYVSFPALGGTVRLTPSGREWFK